MTNLNDVKQFFKDAEPAEAEAAFNWVQAAMEVRGLISIPGTRKRRSDAGQPRNAETPANGDRMKLTEPVR